MIIFKLILILMLAMFPRHGNSLDHQKKSELVMSEHKIEKINSHEDIFKYLDDLKTTLIIYDVDYTLTHPSEPAFQLPNFYKHMDVLREHYHVLSKAEKDLCNNLMVFNYSGSSLIEKNILEILNQLRNKGHKVIALTATCTTKLNNQCFKNMRYSNLKKHGIDFSDSFSDLKEHLFDTLDSNHGSYPAYYHGILFSNGENIINQKAEVLGEFLDKVDDEFEHIIFIDDKKDNLEKVSKLLEKRSPHIKVTGLEYTKAKNYPSKEISSEKFKAKVIHLITETKKAYLNIEKNNSI